MGCRPPARRRSDEAGNRPTRAPIGNRTLDLFLTMETLCRLSYWGAADVAKASRERLQVDLLCDGETTRSAARIRNRRLRSGVSPARPSPVVVRAHVTGRVVGVQRPARRLLLTLPPITYAACLVELARHLLETCPRGRESPLEVGDALRDLLLAGGQHRHL